jgi:hypothetical protein
MMGFLPPCEAAATGLGAAAVLGTRQFVPGIINDLIFRKRRRFDGP